MGTMWPTLRTSGNTPCCIEALKRNDKGSASILQQYFRNDGGILSGPAPLLTFKFMRVSKTSTVVNCIDASDELLPNVKDLGEVTGREKTEEKKLESMFAISRGSLVE